MNTPHVRLNLDFTCSDHSIEDSQNHSTESFQSPLADSIMAT